MNKNELIDALAERCDLKKNQSSSVVESLLDTIISTLKKGEEVRLIGFGTFLVYDRKATTARNPQTGEPMKIPASKQPKFKAGKALKEAVNV